MASLSIRELGKRFGDTSAVRGVSIDIEDGEFLVLVGPSGSGKSTVLRMIAGLEDPTEGDIEIGGRVVTRDAPKDRDIAMVFQDYALYPHMTVYDNMAFGLQSRGATRDVVRARVHDAAHILNVAELLERYPAQLSGGQRQRVAMGRAIVRDPKVFLFDEPLSNLDAKLRVQMRTEIKRLHQKLGTTVVYVTHDQVEAMTLATRIAIMRDGVVEQIGTPDDIYHSPQNRFVAGFVGSPSMNFLACRVSHEEEGGGHAELRLDDGSRLPFPGIPVDLARTLHGRRLLFGIRPENLMPLGDRGGATAAGTVLEIQVEVVEPLGSDTLAIGSIAGSEAVVRLPQGHPVRAGECLPLAPDLARAHLFDERTGRRLEGVR